RRGHPELCGDALHPAAEGRQGKFRGVDDERGGARPSLAAVILGPGGSGPPRLGGTAPGPGGEAAIHEDADHHGYERYEERRNADDEFPPHGGNVTRAGPPKSVRQGSLLRVIDLKALRENPDVA